MKKILFILVATMIIISCSTETKKKNETTFIVKFKDGTEMQVIGTDANVGKHVFFVYHGGVQTSVFAKDEVLYILKDKEE